MLQHGRVLDHDPFSVDPQGQWINVHWLFQLLVAVLHSVGRFEILTVLKAALAVGVVGTFVLSLRRHVPPGWLIFSGLAMLLVILPRVRVRPEAFSLFFMMLTIALLESVRRGGSTRKLWWLAGTMLVWVNMHGLYVLGVGIIWAAMAGAWLDRRFRRGDLAGRLPTSQALAPILAATVAVLVSPWPIDAAIHPLVLWTRIAGKTLHYTYGVTELAPTWRHPGAHLDAVAMVLLTVLAMALNRKRLPAAHVVWLVAFVGLAALARRNVGLAGPVLGYLLAWHGAAAIRRLAARRTKLRRAGPYLAAGMCVLAVLLTAACATGALWRAMGRDRQLGIGLKRAHYPIAAAMFLRDLPGKGDVFCQNFGDAATFIYHSYPRRRVYMDGRLEAHCLARLEDQYRIANALRTPEAADNTPLPDQIRFIFVRHDAAEHLSAMAQSRRFRLIRADGVGACFERTDWPMGAPSRAKLDLADIDLPLARDGLVKGLACHKRHWYAQNPRPVYHQLGTLLLSLGQYTGREPKSSVRPTRTKCIVLAIRYLAAAGKAGIVPAQAAEGMLAKAYLQMSLHEDAPASMSLPVDMNSVRALVLYGRLDFAALGDRDARVFRQYQIVALKAAGQLDLTRQAMEDLFERLPPRQQVQPPRDYLELRNTVDQALEAAKARAAQLTARQLPLLQTIDRLTSPGIGLMQAAVARLQAQPNPTDEMLLALGDLMLRQGRLGEARSTYAKVSVGPEDAWRIDLRRALCSWAEGRLFTAADELAGLAAACTEPLPRYYQAALLEQLGWYDQARSAIAGVAASAPDVQRLLVRLRSRLAQD